MIKEICQRIVRYAGADKLTEDKESSIDQIKILQSILSEEVLYKILSNALDPLIKN